MQILKPYARPCAGDTPTVIRAAGVVPDHACCTAVLLPSPTPVVEHAGAARMRQGDWSVGHAPAITGTDPDLCDLEPSRSVVTNRPT